MRLIFMVVAVSLALGEAHAGGGVVYGTLTRAGKPVPDAVVLLVCPVSGLSDPRANAVPEATARTDPRGGFTLFARSPAARSCQVRVRVGSRESQPLDIFVSDSSLKYELEIDADLNLTPR